MKLKIESNKFISNELYINSATFFKGPKVFLNNEEVKLKKSKAIIKNDSGEDVEIKLKNIFIDSIPQVYLDGELHHPGGKLFVQEYIAIGLPVILMFIGGAIGGGIGVYSAHINGTLVRDFRERPILKYSLCLVTTVLATLIYLFTALFIQMLIRQYQS